MQLEQLVARIDRALGEELPATSQRLTDGEEQALHKVFGDPAFQDYLQDQVNRQIIRDYLTNAVVLGFLPLDALEPLDGQLSTPEARASMSLHMLMSAVEQAAELLADGVPPQLEPLQTGEDTPPHIHLVRS